MGVWLRRLHLGPIARKLRLHSVWRTLRQDRRAMIMTLGVMALLVSLLAWRVATLPSLHPRGSTPKAQSGLTSASTATVTASPLSPSAATPIDQENHLLGTTDWILPPDANPLLIQGYAGRVSALPGETIALYVSLATPGPFSLSIYRLGWYGGAGGRLITSIHDQPGVNQGIWTAGQGLAHCASCRSDPKTGLLDANWKISYSLVTDPSWVTGVYLIKLSAANHAQSYIPLVLREPMRNPALLLQLPVNTYQAYNLWGGASLYQRATHSNVNGEESGNRATKVSFNRPYDRSAGAGDLLSWDISTIRWIERSGYDVGYTTNIDVALNPETLFAAQIFLSVGHDEYWTKSMRDGAENARDHGVSLAFFGANDVYWQARLEPDAQDHPARTLVCYKVATNAKTPDMALKNDPYYPADPGEVTAQWRDKVVGRPENELMGLMYRSYLRYQAGTTKYVPDWVVTKYGTDPVFAGTGLMPGEHIRGGLLGYEYDGYYADAATPTTLKILAESPVTNVYGNQEVAVTAYYRAASGALIFDAGSIWWGWGLDDLTVPFASQPNVLKGNDKIKVLTQNILKAMLRRDAAPTPTSITTPTTIYGGTPKSPLLTLPSWLAP